MTRKTTPRFKKVIRVYLGEREFDKVRTAAEQSMCRSLSEYGRKTMLNRPITVQYRNRSADEAVEASIELIATLKKLLSHPSWAEPEKDWLREKIVKIEEATLTIFSLCLPK